MKPGSKFRGSESCRPRWNPDAANVQWDLDCSISLSLNLLVCTMRLILFYLPLEIVLHAKVQNVVSIIRIAEQSATVLALTLSDLWGRSFRALNICSQAGVP